MISTTSFLLLTGAVASLLATMGDPRTMTRILRAYAAVFVALICLGAALWIVFPQGDWFFPAALSINGAACIAHGMMLTYTQEKLFTGFLFSILGGFQLGLVLIAAIHAQ